MKTEARCTNPLAIEYTITATATLREWKEIGDALTKAEWSNATMGFRNQIRNLVDIASHTFEAEEPT
jgi:hypothetical protein